MRLRLAIIPFIVISVLVVSIVEGFAIHPVYAQTNTSNGNMTDAMVILARFHLKAADTALANGNNTAALNELTSSTTASTNVWYENYGYTRCRTSHATYETDWRRGIEQEFGAR